jgi:hypothetical protein
MVDYQQRFEQAVQSPRRAVLDFILSEECG